MIVPALATLLRSGRQLYAILFSAPNRKKNEHPSVFQPLNIHYFIATFLIAVLLVQLKTLSSYIKQTLLVPQLYRLATGFGRYA